ncbi:hypothetical protein [Streptomyces sp. NPDC002853]
MGVNIVVGALVDAEDDDYIEMVRADFLAIGELLERAGARQWTEPDLDDEEGAEFEAWGYSGLHTVRRLAVHLAADERLPEPLDRTRRATDDPLLSKMYEAFPSDPPGPFDHLVHHSDCEGYYVPVDFAHVIVDKKARGGYLGSSEDPAAEGWQRYRVESYVCLQLLRAAKLSVSTGAAIAFS